MGLFDFGRKPRKPNSSNPRVSNASIQNVILQCPVCGRRFRATMIVSPTSLDTAGCSCGYRCNVTNIIG